MGHARLTAEQRAAVLELDRADPQATQAEIARAAGVSRATVSRIEGGRRRPRTGQAGHVAQRMADMPRL
jgi:transcriptional regulator with XRE-family HTH domain